MEEKIALITCPECGQSVSDKAKICVHCGFELNNTKICSECGSALESDDKFCIVCGCPIEISNEKQLEIPIESNELPAELLTEKTAVELINYIQFSVAKIINGKSKGLLEDEFDTVINNINPSSLQDIDLITVYEDLLKSLTMLKLNENQREQARKILERKKKNAITHSLNSFGSIFVPGGNIATMFAAAAYTGLSAVLNYKRAVNDAKIENEENEFEINQSDLECIDSLRSDLFIATAKVFSNRSNSVQGLVSENEMKQFAVCANEIADGTIESINSTLVLMESAEEVLKSFPPYWVVLAIGYNKVGNKKACFDALNNFDKLMENNPIFKKNPYVLSSAKTRINNIIGNLENGNLSNEDKDSIKKCIEVIKLNTPSLQQETDNLNFDLVQLYGIVGDFEAAKKSIIYLKARNLIGNNSRLETQLKILQEGALKSPETIGLIEKAFSTVTFGITEETKKLLESMSDKINIKKSLILCWDSNIDIYSLCFSKELKSSGVSPRFNRYEISNEGGKKQFLIEVLDFSWNDLAEQPFLEIKTNEFTAYFKTTIDEVNENWPYTETISLQEKITKDISLLGDKETIEKFKSFHIKDGAKFCAKLAGGAVFGLIGLGIAAAASAKDIKKAWTEKDKLSLTWLVLTLISIKDKNGNSFDLIDNDNQLLLDDFRG